MEAEESGERSSCANCGRSRLATELDAERWCERCRREVVRRATVAAQILGGVGAAAMGLWIILVLRPGPRFMLVWVILAGFVYFILFTLTRRVAFEVFRSRGVHAPEED